jgi:hypothetical protein
MLPDIINSSFELCGFFAICLSIRQIMKDKKSYGVSVFHVLFFSLWGGWNLWYYPSLNQWSSFAAGVLVFVANTVWVSLLIYYTRKQKQETGETL